MIARLALLAGLTAIGAMAAIWLGLPVPLLVGPAVLVTCVCLAGLPLVFPTGLRDAVFVVAGVAIGATVSQESVAALSRWPMAFMLMAMAIVLTVLLGQLLMQRLMQTDPRSALLAATPGHLSYVIALGEHLKLATDRVVVVQSVRLLALTLLVPFAVRISGIETGVGLAATGTAVEMSLIQTGLCIAAAVVVALILRRTPAPAPMLLAGMIVGAMARLTDYAPGGLSHWIAYPVLAAIGTLIGTRFAGITLRQLRQSAVAGVAGTTLAALISLIAAWLAAGIVEMPVIHVLVAFAPGGLETMAVLGATIGANPGFVAAAHVGRLLLLAVMIPILVSRVQEPLPVRR